MIRLCVVLSALLWLTVIPAFAANEYPLFEEGNCPFEVEDGVEVDCGYLIVPEDHDDPDSLPVSIAVAIFRSDSSSPEDDPLIYLDGGPGGFTLENWGTAYTRSFEPFAGNRDVILFDQRGTGYSEPSLFCDETAEYRLESLDDELTDSEGAESYTDALFECHDRLVDDGIDLAHYNSVQSAADIAALVEVLELDEVNLLGISYGSRLALTVLREYGEEGWVRSVILDGVYPPQVDRSAESIINFDRVLSELFETCADDDICADAFPDLEAVLYDTADSLEKDPVIIEVPLPSTGDTYEVLLDGDTFFRAIFDAMYATWLLPSIPQAIYATSAGDFGDIEYYMSLSLDGVFSFSDGLYYSVECAEETPFNELEDTIEATEQFPDLAEFWASEEFVGEAVYVDTCANWSDLEPDESENEAIESDIPALVMNGQFDPVTPPNWGELAAETLENSFVFTYPGVGHGASISGEDCPFDMALAFLEDPDDEPRDNCMRDMGVSFSTPVTAIELEDFRDDEFSVSGVRPEGWVVVDESGFASDSTYVNAIYYRVAQEGDGYLEYLIEFFGVSNLPDPVETVEANRLDWDIYRFEAGQYTDYIILAVTVDRDDNQYIVLIAAGSLAEEELFYEELLPEAIESFEYDG